MVPLNREGLTPAESANIYQRGGRYFITSAHGTISTPNEPATDRIYQTICCVVGAGPAGVLFRFPAASSDLARTGSAKPSGRVTAFSARRVRLEHPEERPCMMGFPKIAQFLTFRYCFSNLSAIEFMQ